MSAYQRAILIPMGILTKRLSKMRVLYQRAPKFAKAVSFKSWCGDDCCIGINFTEDNDWKAALSEEYFLLFWFRVSP